MGQRPRRSSQRGLQYRMPAATEATGAPCATLWQCIDSCGARPRRRAARLGIATFSQCECYGHASGAAVALKVEGAHCRPRGAGSWGGRRSADTEGQVRRSCTVWEEQ
uniref:Uncharacterized protein n=1 Tax=Alexandrium catenella TaxID=2925 RepID=A0A7S1R4I9_ALECA|mmetsp:Transcript_44730/g.120487  ORF Transcript_44730/g.120487 Transcript_44730/m.120487 type:complete len:108 (+) Transcript_44730:63-386(+)